MWCVYWIEVQHNFIIWTESVTTSQYWCYARIIISYHLKQTSVCLSSTQYKSLKAMSLHNFSIVSTTKKASGFETTRQLIEYLWLNYKTTNRRKSGTKFSYHSMHNLYTYFLQIYNQRDIFIAQANTQPLKNISDADVHLNFFVLYFLSVFVFILLVCFTKE